MRSAKLPRSIYVVSVVGFCVALGYGIIAPIVPIFAATFGVSAFAASSIVSTFAATRMLWATPAGRLVNKFGERRTLWTGLTIVFLSTLLAGFSQKFWQLLVFRSLGGIGSVMFSVSVMSLILRSAPEEMRGQATSFYQGVFIIGLVTGPALGGATATHSIRTPFFVYAGTVALAVTSAYFLLPKGTPNENAIGEATNLPEVTVREALQMRAYWIVLLITFATGVTTLGMRNSVFSLFVVDGLGQSAAKASIGFMLASGVQALLLTRSGKISDRFGRRPALIIGATALVIGMTTITLVAALSGYFAAMVALGISAAFLAPTASATIADLAAPRPTGRMIAAYQMVSDLGAITGPLVGGWLIDATRGFGWTFGFGTAIAFIALIAASFARETAPDRRRPATAVVEAG